MLLFPLICQGKSKSDGSPTVIRLTTPEGNMNPKFGEVDLVPDDDLNTKLKFYVSTHVVKNEKCQTFPAKNSENIPRTSCSFP